MFINIIKSELNKNVEIIDTGIECAESLNRILIKKELTSNAVNPEYKFYLTDVESKFLEIANRILKDKYIISVDYIELVKI